MPAPFCSRRATYATNTSGGSGKRRNCLGKVLVPGVVSPATNVVEHPDGAALASKRLDR
jgi:hypothetical protein